MLAVSTMIYSWIICVRVPLTRKESDGNMETKKVVLLVVLLLSASLTFVQLANAPIEPRLLDLYCTVSDFHENYTDWVEVGDSPYLDRENDGSYIYTNGHYFSEGDFLFSDIEETGTINSVHIEFYCNKTGGALASFHVYVNNGTHGTQYYYYAGEIKPDTTYSWKSLDISSIVSTWAEVNDAKFYLLTGYQLGGHCISIDCARLRIDVKYVLGTGIVFTPIDETINVLSNETFILASKMRFDEPAKGYTYVIVAWDNNETDPNAPYWNFTYEGFKCWFTDGTNFSGPITVDIYKEVPYGYPPGYYRYVIVIMENYGEGHDGEFWLNVTMRAAGLLNGVYIPHSKGDECIIMSVFCAEDTIVRARGTSTIHVMEPHDVAVTSVIPSATEAYPTWETPLDIKVTVKNEGNFTETFNVTAYYDNNPIETKIVTNLAPQEDRTLTFEWNIPSIPKTYPYPTYTMKAQAEPPYDMYWENNIKVNGTVTVKWPGDASGDGQVDGNDQMILGDSWYKRRGDPMYDQRADFNNDGIVNIFDLIILGNNWYNGPLDIVKASIIKVPDDFPTIQEAINVANPGDTIEVGAGTYYEHVSISKEDLTLKGEELSTTIIDGNGTGSVITVTANNAVISGFTIRNGDSGISLSYSNDSTISGNFIKNNVVGIELIGSSGNTFYHNNFINNQKQAEGSILDVWDDGYPSGGNYWSDYTGVDQYSGPYQNETGSDGIGDTPYEIDGNNQDNYPLMTPWPFVGIEFELDTLYNANITIQHVYEKGYTLRVNFYTYGGSLQNFIDIPNPYGDDLQYWVWNNDTQGRLYVRTIEPGWDMRLWNDTGVGIQSITLTMVMDEEQITVASFVVSQSILSARTDELNAYWPYATPQEKSWIFREQIDIDDQWPYAPP